MPGEELNSSLLRVTPTHRPRETVKVMRRRREPRLEDAFVEHPMQALAALAISLFLGICFIILFVSTLWAVAVGLPIGVGLWLVGALLVARHPASGWFEN
jgi:hypothetical protein